MATAALIVLPATAALAEGESNSGTLVYSGSAVTVAEGQTIPNEATFTVECVDGTCTVNDVYPTLVFVDGEAVTPASGEFDDQGCSFSFTSIRDVQLTASTISGTSVIPPFTGPCDDGTTLSGGERTTTFDLAYESGEVCLIDASCIAAATPGTAAGNATSLPLSNPGPFSPGGERPFATPTEVSSVATLAEVFTLANIAWAAAGTVVLAILIAIPTQFANSAADTLAASIRERWRRWRARSTGSEPTTKVAFSGWPWAAGGVLAAAVIAALADPNFGFDAAGLRLFLSIIAAFAVEVVLGWLAVTLIVRRTHPSAAVSFQFAPISLVIVVGAVLISRLSGFEPPIIFGLVAGVVFGGLLGTAERARVALIGLGWAFGIGVLSWIAYSVLPADLTVARELLAIAAISGISALPIALLPLRGLAGHTVWEWKKTVWAAAYAIGLFAFLLVLLPLPGAWTEVGMGLWTWVALFVAYSLGAVGVWLVVTKPWKKQLAES